MNQGFDVCILREGHWEIASFFPAGEDQNAIQEAMNLQSGYAAVCVIAPDEMTMLYFHSLKGLPKPSYYTVRANLRNERRTLKNNIRVSPDDILQETPANTAPAATLVASPALTSSQPQDFWGWIILFISRLFPRFSTHPKHPLPVAEKAPTSTESTTAPLTPQKQEYDSTSLLEDAHAVPSSDGPADKAPLPVAEHPLKSDTILHSEPKLSERPLKNTPLPEVIAHSPTAEDIAQIKRRIGKVLLSALQRAKSLAWIDEEKRMYGNIHFGMILMLTGIGRYCAEALKCPSVERNQILAQALMGLNLSSDQAFQCILHVDRFLKTPENAMMYKIGRAYGKAALHHEEDMINMHALLDGWQSGTLIQFFPQISALAATQASLATEQPHVKEPLPETASLLLTDIANFTARSESQGPQWTKDVITAHNRIVRTAIHRYNGKELKQTGDGMKAVFTDALDAIQAAASMQMMLQNFSRRVPTRLFEVKMVVATGPTTPEQSFQDAFLKLEHQAEGMMQHVRRNDIHVNDATYAQTHTKGVSFERLQEADTAQTDAAQITQERAMNITPQTYRFTGISPSEEARTPEVSGLTEAFKPEASSLQRAASTP